jgi:phosphoglycerate kinase
MKTLTDFDFKNKSNNTYVIDFNVRRKLNVTDATRIEAAKPTIDAILSRR